MTVISSSSSGASPAALRPRVGEFVKDAWKDYTDKVKPSGYLHNEDYYDENDYYYDNDDSYYHNYDPWKSIYKDGRYSRTQYYNPLDDPSLPEEKASTETASAAQERHPLGSILNSIRPGTLLLLLSIPLFFGGLYYLFVVNGPTPVVRARINDLIDNLDNENDIPTALYNFLIKMNKEWLRRSS